MTAALKADDNPASIPTISTITKPTPPKPTPPKPTAPTPPPVDEELVAASIPDENGAYWITAEIAELWLTRNRKNRPIRVTRVAAMTRDMQHGGWAYTGEAIKFSTDGTLIDGQHRLRAVVNSGATVKMFVVLDVPPESQAYMDAGARRTAADALAFKDEANSSTLAATARFAILFESGRSASSRESVTHAEIIEWISDNPTVRRQVAATARFSSKLDAKPSVFAYAMYKLTQIDQEMANAFFFDIVEMRTSGFGDPISTLLQRFRTARKQREKLSHKTELSFIYRAWNAYRTGTQLKILKVPTGDMDMVVPR